MFVLKTKIITISFIYLFLSGCFYYISPLRQAQKALKKKDCKSAQNIFISVKNKNIEFAKQAAKICLVKNPTYAAWFYFYLSQKEDTLKKRLFFKEHLAFTYFNKLKNYEKAIEVFSFLKKQKTLNKKQRMYSFYIALSFFKREKWEVALKEINFLNKQNKKPLELKRDFLKKDILKEDIMFLKARILLMQKKYKKAEVLFKKIKLINKDYFKNNKIFFYLSFIYESQNNFPQAISELENLKSTSDFLKNKIKRLKIRQKKQPGEAYF